jgi:hypothetical protein
LRRDDSDYVVFLLCQPEDPQAFCERFGGERLATPATAPPLRENQVDRLMERGETAAAVTKPPIERRQLFYTST